MKNCQRSIKRISTSVLIALTFILAGCTTQPSGYVIPDPYKASLDEQALYLRGTFNWWGVQESFRFVSNGTNSWSARVYLEADGRTEDFKISDPNWSPLQTCGGLDKKVVMVEKIAVKLFCNIQSQNFQFTPHKNGNYEFRLAKQSGSYTLSINRL
ncbi:hypothetical protein J3L16_13965 [Alteromonas sp. 5E99-2]|uniref:hypothetical protein n=1 Tax=Alteromonas sp. 5E99-2 TaxID=2817683 RepID=UPI001A98DBCA|nr:hypothetical protein [Alteromonas sp. 5E99-2]MBO1256795.1 hypothetical protein [Alteromonas sp. 5E99-2]